MSAIKKTRNKPLSDVQKEKVLKAIEDFDFQWWFKRRLVSAARLELSKKVGFPIGVSAFKSLREAGACKWFRVKKRPSPSKNYLLDEKEWERLRLAVKEQAVLIQGRTLEEAVAIVSLIYRCNSSTLRGLTKDLHFWNSN